MVYHLWSFVLALLVSHFGSVLVNGHADCAPGTTELYLAQSNLDVFPNLTACASTLRLLDLSYNGISVIPTKIGELTALEVLKLDSNQISSLPWELGQLYNLHTLWLNFNHLSDLPASIGWLYRLTSLHLQGNSFYEVPYSLFSLVNLEELTISPQTSFTRLPTELSNLRNITYLDLGQNYAIYDVPAELGFLHKLAYFYAGDNIHCWPRSMKRLPHFYFSYSKPACTNQTVTGYVMHRARNEHECGGPVRNTSGNATGCIDYVRSTCMTNGDSITVQVEELSDLSSAGLNCDPSAPVVNSYSLTYARCDANTGVASSCIDTKGADALYPHRHAGLTTLKFGGWEQCSANVDNLLLARRRLSTEEAESVNGAPVAAEVAPEVAEISATEDALALPEVKKDVERYRQPHAEMPALQAAAKQRARQAMDTHKMDFQERVLAQNMSECGETLFLWYPTSYDFSNCYNLRNLSIYGGTNMSDFAEQIPALITLQFLELQQIYEDIPDNLDQLPNLKTLVISWLNQPGIPEVVRRMRTVTSLRVAFNWSPTIMPLPDWLGELTQLTELAVNYARLHSWPVVVNKLVNLRKLTLYACEIWQSPTPDIAHLTKLEKLDLSYNYFSSLPASVGTLIHLKQLMLYGTSVQCLPQSVRALPGLATSWDVQSYPPCPEVPAPTAFAQQRNAACLWDPFYEFWYKSVCEGGEADKVSVVLYADSNCKKQAKRKAVHPLSSVYPGVGYCMPMWGWGGALLGYSLQYCHEV